MIRIIGLIIGLAVTAAGIYYLVTEKDDRESVKIYTAVTAVGAILSVVTGLLMVFA